MAKRSARWSERVFIAEGAELLRAALRAGVSIESVYLAPEGVNDPGAQECCAQAMAAGARLFSLAPGVMERVSDTVTPQPVLAVLPMFDHPALVSGAAGVGALVVVMVDVRDPGNAGTVLRTADASGARAVIFSGDSVDPYNPKTVRASAGSIFHIPFAVQDDPIALARSLAAAGYRTLATTVGAGSDYAAVDFTRPSALFLGNESSGLAPQVCDELSGAIAIPMEGRAESLNVAVACAVVCFEALRQRRVGHGA